MYIDRLRYLEEEWRWVQEPEQFDTEADFAINGDVIEREICRMGQLMVRYGTVAGEQEANLKRFEERAKYVAAQVSMALRSTAEKNGVKTTESKLQEEVTVNTEYQAALHNLHVLRADATKADHWWRAILKKADLLNSLSYRQGAEYKRG
jgi:benzoyl-CoA reductase/2-hydroxyglutaryl-CoA dehydratase subunit BcrC/BadD/HgdB